MSDAVQRYVKWTKAHVDRIAVAVLFFILAIMIFLWYSEQSNSAANVEQAAPTKLPEVMDKNAYYKTIVAMTTATEITKYPSILQIQRYNMFDYKSVKQKEAIEREANQKFAQAKDAADKGQVEDAKRLLKEILDQFPTHQKARQLYEQLNPAPAKEGAPAAGVN